MNYDYKIKLKEELISHLAIMKVLFDRKQIAEEDFKRTSEYILKNPNYSDYVEKASDIASAQIDLIIESEVEEVDDVKAGRVMFSPTDKNGKIFCDVLMLSKNNIHAVKVVSMECDFIEPSESREMMNIGYKAVNKYLCQTSSDTIDLTVVQPNLLVSTGCRLNIESLLDDFDKRLLQ